MKMFTCKQKGTFCVLYVHACQKEEKKKEMIPYKRDEKTNKIWRYGIINIENESISVIGCKHWVMELGKHV